MKRVVVDASVALAWCFPDEASDYADKVLIGLEGHVILVPAVWGLEIANAELVGERAKRLRELEIRRFAALLESLAPIQDEQSVRGHLSNTLPLARKYNLSAYGAAYLELAMRHGVALATLDERLQTAAQKAGIRIFAGKK